MEFLRQEGASELRVRQSISSVGSKLFLRTQPCTYHTENRKLLRTFTTPNALLSLILKMLRRMPTYCMPVAYPLYACHPPAFPTSRILYRIYTVIYLMLGGVHLCLEANISHLLKYARRIPARGRCLRRLNVQI
jgi:hypothetical protein